MIAGAMRRAGRALRTALVALALAVLGTALLSAPPALRRTGDPDGFDLLAFFDGAARSEGTITTGFVRTEPFTATFAGHREGAGLVLDERFTFADGATRLQRWRLAADPAGRVSGTVETEIADGTLALPVRVEGRLLVGGAVLDYQGYAPGGGRVPFHFRHDMTAIDAETVENRVGVRILGFPVATSRVVFRRVPAPPPAPAAG